MFEHFAMDLSRREVRRDGAVVPIEPKAFELIAFIIDERDRMGTKQELVDTVWQGEFIADASLSTAIKTAQRALGDGEQAQRLIKTVQGQGFRFVAEVREKGSAPASARPSRQPREERPQPGVSSRPSIAVLRLLSLAEDSKLMLLANALPAELISALSRLKWTHVIARASSFSFDPESFLPWEVMTNLNEALFQTFPLSDDALRRQVAGSLHRPEPAVSATRHASDFRMMRVFTTSVALKTSGEFSSQPGANRPVRASPSASRLCSY
ncbi:MAG: winged helix-turn-helix domain-containing protein [Pseudomonadota bacterium]